MAEGRGARGRSFLGAGGAGDALRGKVVGAIQSNQQRVVKITKRIDDTGGGQGVAEGGEDGEEGLGRDRVEQIADLIIARNESDAKEGLCIGAAFGVAQGALMGKEGRRLSEEDGKGSEGGIFDGVRSYAVAGLWANPTKM